MKKKILVVVVAVTLLSVAYAAENSWTWDFKPLRATYSIYSGAPGERDAPTKKERKLAIAIDGQAAKEIFDSIYPDAKVTCSDEPGERVRSKGKVACTSGLPLFLGGESEDRREHFGCQLLARKTIVPSASTKKVSPAIPLVNSQLGNARAHRLNISIPFCNRSMRCGKSSNRATQLGKLK
jgi:hypothetical protein